MWGGNLCFFMVEIWVVNGDCEVWECVGIFVNGFGF